MNGGYPFWRMLLDSSTPLALLFVIAIQLWSRRDIRKIEIATNSMKDALVKETGLRAGLEGEKRGREERELSVDPKGKDR